MQTITNSTKKLLTSLFLVLILISPTYVFAAPKDNAAVEKQRIDNLKERANREIDRRISSLSKLTDKISTIARITDAQKASLNTEIANNVAELTSLKDKIATDTELSVLKNDVKSIVDSYRIYAIFIPKIHLLASVNKTDQAQIKLSEIAVKLEAKIKILKDSGKDVSRLETNLAEMKTNLTNAKTKINTLQEKIISVIPSGYPGNKNVLIDGKNTMALIKKDLASARQNAAQVIAGIKAINQQN